MERLGRLVSLLTLIQQHQKITAKQLAEHFEVTERTIYRDIDALVLYGIPIIASGGAGGGFSLPQNYSISLTQLNRNQIGLMSIGSIAISGFVDFLDDFNDVENIQDIIFSGVPKSLQDTAKRHAKLFYFDRSRWYLSYIPSDVLRVFKTAVLADRKVIIQFLESDESNNSSNHKTETVDPYGLVFKSDTWYLVGYSYIEYRMRRWNISRVKSAEVQVDQFDRPESFSLEQWWKEELEAYGQGENLVRLAIDKKAWANFSRIEWKKTNRFFHNETHVIVELFVDRDDWIVDIVMTCKGDVQVLEPVSLKEKVISATKRLLAYHTEGNNDFSQCSLENPESLNLNPYFESLSLSPHPFDS